MSNWIEKCSRVGCNKIATHAWVNGCGCADHTCDPGLETTMLHYSPQQLDAYRQGWAAAIEAVRVLGENEPVALFDATPPSPGGNYSNRLPAGYIAPEALADIEARTFAALHGVRPRECPVCKTHHDPDCLGQ